MIAAQIAIAYFSNRRVHKKGNRALHWLYFSTFKRAILCYNLESYLTHMMVSNRWTHMEMATRIMMSLMASSIPTLSSAFGSTKKAKTVSH